MTPYWESIWLKYSPNYSKLLGWIPVPSVTQLFRSKLGSYLTSLRRAELRSQSDRRLINTALLMVWNLAQWLVKLFTKLNKETRAETMESLALFCSSQSKTKRHEQRQWQVSLSFALHKAKQRDTSRDNGKSRSLLLFTKQNKETRAGTMESLALFCLITQIPSTGRARVPQIESCSECHSTLMKNARDGMHWQSFCKYFF